MAADGHAHFRMREKLISIGDDYWIQDDSGTRRYRVDGKAVRYRDTWVLEDAPGHERAKVREKKLSIRDAITIDVGGREAIVKKALVGIRTTFTSRSTGKRISRSTGMLSSRAAVRWR